MARRSTRDPGCGSRVDGKRESCAWLEAAQSWASTRPGRRADGASWLGGECCTVLVASSDLRLNALLSTRCRHIRQHDQLDLFIDSAQTAAVNALVDALAVRNVGEARGALDRLERINRDHGQRFHAVKLIAALEAPATEGPEQGIDRLERMDASGSPPRLSCSAPVGAIFWHRCGATSAARSTRPRSVQAIPNAMRPGRTARGSTGSA